MIFNGEQPEVEDEIVSLDGRPAREIVDVNALEWHSREGISAKLKVLHFNEDFSYVSITSSVAGDVGPPHVHVGPAEVFFLEGSVETAAGFAGKGYWVLEPAGAMHRATRTLTDGAALTHMKGPMLLLNQEGAAPLALYGQGMKATISGQSSGAMTPADLTNVMYPEDYDSGVVHYEAMDWIPSGYEGVRFKVLHVGEDGWFSLFIEADDGTVIPRRRYTSPADFYVVSGCLRFADGDAPADHWVLEPRGAVDEEVQHIGTTSYLATFSGAALDLSENGAVQRVVDGQAMRDLSDPVVSAAT